jgi:carbamoyl-phosphate synthase large subunit
MPKRRTVLITCAGGSGPIYLAKKMGRKFNVVLADGDDQNAGAHLGFPFYRIPFGNKPNFKRAILSIVKKHRVDLIVPGADEELEGVSELLLESSHLSAVIPSSAFIRLCLNKKDLMAALDKEGISKLLPFVSPTAVKYPAIAKPIYGRGSKAVHILSGARNLEGYLKLYGKPFSDVLVQPFVDGDEYTVSVIVNDLNKLIGIVPKRVISKRGITRSAVSESNKTIEAMCRKIIDRFEPSGPFNVQLKLRAGKAFIFEINPRLSTTSVLTEKAFGNEAELYFKYLGDSRVPAPRKIKEGVYLYRYEENVFK